MRCYQPSNGIFLRESLEDHYIGEVPIQKGTVVILSPMSNAYSPKYYENPFEFKPERWINSQN